MEVEIPGQIARRMPAEKLVKLREVLAQDPRPAYHHDESRVYGFPFDGYEVKFSVNGNRAVLQSLKRLPTKPVSP